MRLVDVLTALDQMDAPVFDTRDVAARLGIGIPAASAVLGRLRASGRVASLRRGVWMRPNQLDPLALPEYLTFPLPSYVSLQSALYLHGMISQIPSVTYAVSLARTRRYTTPDGTVSVHHVVPGFFFGFTAGPKGGHLATPEKSLVDFLYLSPARSQLFRRLPELELPRTFSVRRAREDVARIPAPRRRVLVERALDRLLAAR